MMTFRSRMMSQKSQSKKVRKPKARNWIAVQAHFKTGAGPHGGGKKQKYTRKTKHKVRYA